VFIFIYVQIFVNAKNYFQIIFIASYSWASSQLSFYLLFHTESLYNNNFY